MQKVDSVTVSHYIQRLVSRYEILQTEREYIAKVLHYQDKRIRALEKENRRLHSELWINL